MMNPNLPPKAFLYKRMALSKKVEMIIYDELLSPGSQVGKIINYCPPDPKWGSSSAVLFPAHQTYNQ